MKARPLHRAAFMLAYTNTWSLPVLLLEPESAADATEEATLQCWSTVNVKDLPNASRGPPGVLADLQI